MKNVLKQVEKITKNTTFQVLDETDKVAEQVNSNFNRYMTPVRNNVLKRYPVLFSLLIAFGLTTTYYGFEKILSQYETLNRYPWLILLLGIFILALTGRLYKKLS